MSVEIELGGGNSSGIVGRLFGAFFFLIFLAFGVFFTFLIADDVLGGLQTYSWSEGQCQIIRAKVSSRGDDFSIEASFRVIGEAESLVSKSYTIKEKTSSSYSELQRIAESLVPGSRVKCFYPVGQPGKAIIERPSLWSALLILFPLIFVAIGIGGAYFTIFAKRKTTLGQETQSISQRAKSRNKWGGLVAAVFFGAFAVMGGAAGYFFLVKPLLGVYQAQSWNLSRCTVISSNVRSHSSDDGTTYSVNILYSYEIDGKEYRSNRYDFMGGSSSGYESKRKIVRRHPPGKQVDCYINPNDPHAAVLQRDLSWIFLIGLLPLVFFAIGVGGLWFSFVAPKKEQTGVFSDYTGASSSDNFRFNSWSNDSYEKNRSGNIVLKPSVSPLGKLIGISVVTTIFGGAEYFMISELVSSFDYFLAFFVAIWSLFVLGLIAMVFYQILALVNPRPTITIEAPEIRLGGDYALSWSLDGRASMIEKLEIYLTGVEEATYQRGTDSITERNTFHNDAIVSVQNRLQMKSGSVTFKVPENSMHTFDASNNKIVWSVRIHGDIPKWPDVDETMKISVLPRSNTVR